MTNSVGFGQGDSAYYVGETPPQSEAEVDEARPPRRPRERARLLGHELEVREDHEVELLQQRRRRRPEHARLGALRADRQRDHREQQHLLEQLQLLPAELERARPSRAASGQVGGSARSTTRPESASSSRRRRLDRPEQPDLRQLQVRSLGRLGPVQRGRQRDLARTTSSSTTRWAAAARTPTQVDFFTDGSGSAQLLLRATSSSTFDPSTTAPDARCTRAARRRPAPAAAAPAPATAGSSASWSPTSPPTRPRRSSARGRVHDAPGVREVQAAELTPGPTC